MQKQLQPLPELSTPIEGSRNVLSLSTSSLSEKQKLSPTSQAKPPTSVSIPLSVERSEACCVDRGWRLAANAPTSCECLTDGDHFDIVGD
ncbi:hypothetical protein NL676_033990 [Syzygium grande]|nr:hypothetical protein NL676_033990 [Syzygium grande]